MRKRPHLKSSVQRFDQLIARQQSSAPSDVDVARVAVFIQTQKTRRLEIDEIQNQANALGEKRIDQLKKNGCAGARSQHAVEAKGVGRVFGSRRVLNAAKAMSGEKIVIQDTQFFGNIFGIRDQSQKLI